MSNPAPPYIISPAPSYPYGARSAGGIFLDPTRSAGQFLDLFTEFKRTGFIADGQKQGFDLLTILGK
jgi:hypothetical protein